MWFLMLIGYLIAVFALGGLLGVVLGIGPLGFLLAILVIAAIGNLFGE